jgi:hypothetical protein
MHGLGMFDDPKIFYFNNPLVHLYNNNWILDHNKISKLKEYNLVIADFSSEHYGNSGLDHVYNALDQQEINFLLLTHEPTEHQKYPRMFFYNHWYQWSRKNFNKPAQQENRQWAWSCLNGNPRPHRIYNFLFSKQQEYFSQACFSFFRTLGATTRTDDIQLESEMQQQWDVLKEDLPERIGSLNPKISASCFDHTDIGIPALADSYIHLVTETTVVSKIFITEKVWKPIASMQLFLVFGNPGTVEFLRSLGVDVFDDIINHDYDQDPDWKSRLTKIHQELKKLIDTGISTHWQATQQRRRSNYDNFWANNFDGDYSTDIKLAISRYLK